MLIGDDLVDLTGEIGEGSRCSSHTVIPATGEATRVDLGPKAPRPLGVGAGPAIEVDRAEVGVEHTATVHRRGARCFDSAGNNRRRLAIGTTKKMFRIGPLHRDTKIEPIEQRP